MVNLIETLNRTNCSVVIRSNKQERLYFQRGVNDLLDLLHDEPQVLRDAQLADKVVGKAAAALMILGEVREVYARTISQSALVMLQSAGIKVSYGVAVDHICNRDRTDWCPLEKLCAMAKSVQECHALTEGFVRKYSNNPMDYCWQTGSISLP